MDKEIIYIAVSLVFGGGIGWLLASFRAKSGQSALESENKLLAQSLDENKSELSTIRQKNEGLNADYAALDQNLLNMQEQIKSKTEETELLQERFSIQFENLANKILEEKTKKFTEQNLTSLNTVLTPLKEKIGDFEKKVESSNKESIDRHAALRQQIISLKDLNYQISQEAVNLTKALKGDSKVQGNWGELVLERILEKSGLEKGREYDVQIGYRDEENKIVYPDVVINLPGGKKMIIDSKVSLKSYEEFVNAEDDQDKEQFKKLHVASINRHVDQLSDKNYHDLYKIESPDFVLLFIPVEPAFAVALNSDDKLYNKAFEKNIIIVTPTTLLATLRTIDTMWNNDKQQKNALAIATEAGKMFDQFVNLLAELEKVQKQLVTVQGSFDSSLKKLSGKGNLIGKIEKLKALGAKANKALDEKWKEED